MCLLSGSLLGYWLCNFFYGRVVGNNNSLLRSSGIDGMRMLLIMHSSGVLM